MKPNDPTTKPYLAARIKAFEISEAPDLDPQKYYPDDPENFICTLVLTVGTHNQAGGDLFYITVCTPQQLIAECSQDGFAWGVNRLVVPYFNLVQITRIVFQSIERSSGRSWGEVAAKTCKFAHWEFEDYRP